MTDALEMAGARKTTGRPDSNGTAPGKAPPRESARSLAEVCRLALEAGNDILLFSKPIAQLAEELDSSRAGAGHDSFWRDGFAHCLAASTARIERLTAFIKESGGRPAVREFDDNIYREVARGSIRDAGGSGSIGPSALRPGLEVEFYSEADLFERPPIRDFMERVVAGLSRGGWTLSRVGQAGPGQSPAGPGAPAAGTPSRASSKRGVVPRASHGLESVAYSSGGAPGATRVVFLMNRRPLETAAVRGLCAGADVVVIAEWPYAVDLLEPGRRAIVTYGVYDAAAELVCSQLLSRPSC